MKFPRARIVLAIVALFAAIGTRSFADPLPGEVLKFQQLPLNNGVAAYPGAPVGQPYPGHDEWSTAISNTANNDYQGTFAADDFADNYSTPVVHIRWWGSYDQNTNILLNSSVQKFLISFETDVPPNNAAFPYSQPGTPILTEEVTLTNGALTSGSGNFTESLVNGNVPEHLYQYNAELAMPFQEQADTVYWLKIVALENQSTQTPVKWGWHNRDWGIQDALASPVPMPGEVNEGPVSSANLPVWHFQDDAVNGQIDYGVNPNGVFAINSETNINPLNYAQAPAGQSISTDGPFGTIGSTPLYSEDLAFELFTVPEPSTIVLLGLGTVGIGAKLWRRRRLSDA